MKISCPHWNSNLGSSAYEANALSVELLELMYIDHQKMTAIYLSFICILPVPCGRCNNNLSCIFLIYICIVLLFDLLRRLITVKSYENVLHDKTFYYINHEVQVTNNSSLW